MRRIAFSIVATCALAPLLALAGAAPSSAGPYAAGPRVTAGPQQVGVGLCEKDSPGLCWRDPSDGGPGTSVVNSGFGTDEARKWGLPVDSSRCVNSSSPNGGVVTNTPPCPFTGGSGLNATFAGSEIVTADNVGSGYCAGSSNADGLKVYMHSCDGVGGVSELATVLVLQSFSTHFRLVSVLQSNACFCAEYINGDATNDDQLTVGPAGTYARWVAAG